MSEWDQRQLCPDGACVGVIGADGTCKVCGRAAPNWGEERKRGLIEETVDEDDEDDEDDDEDDEEYEDDDEEAVVEDRGPLVPGDAEWEERKLCPDEACIGVLGDDQRCKVCGRTAA